MNLRDNSIDLVSFNKLFTEYHERFVRFAYTYVDNYMEAEDIVMEAMTYYWENRTRLFGVNPPAYIFTTIKNKCLNYLRDRQYYQTVSEQLQEHAAWKLAIQISTLEACNPEELFSKEMKQLVEHARSVEKERGKNFCFTLTTNGGGFQYTGRVFRQKLVQAGMTQSMSRVLRVALTTIPWKASGIS